MKEELTDAIICGRKVQPTENWMRYLQPRLSGFAVRRSYLPCVLIIANGVSRAQGLDAYNSQRLIGFSRGRSIFSPRSALATGSQLRRHCHVRKVRSGHDGFLEQPG